MFDSCPLGPAGWLALHGVNFPLAACLMYPHFLSSGMGVAGTALVQLVRLTLHVSADALSIPWGLLAKRWINRDGGYHSVFRLLVCDTLGGTREVPWVLLVKRWRTSWWTSCVSCKLMVSDYFFEHRAGILLASCALHPPLYFSSLPRLPCKSTRNGNWLRFLSNRSVVFLT